jgi:hypothetical protein
VHAKLPFALTFFPDICMAEAMSFIQEKSAPFLAEEVF